MTLLCGGLGANGACSSGQGNYTFARCSLLAALPLSL